MLERYTNRVKHFDHLIQTCNLSNSDPVFRYEINMECKERSISHASALLNICYKMSTFIPVKTVGW